MTGQDERRNIHAPSGKPYKALELSQMSFQFRRGDVLSYTEMCVAVGASLQRGMNFRLRDSRSVILMSRRPGAPYADQVSDDGRLLTYEGHDCARSVHVNPKQVDQPDKNPGGSLTQNGLFIEAVSKFKSGTHNAEKIAVFEKIKDGIWVYNGVFDLVDVEIDQSTGRRVFKFKLVLSDAEEQRISRSDSEERPEDDRIIPSWVKLEVWKRDQGRCRICGAQSHLHFDHIIPYSKGGSSKDPANLQILCLRHNLQKHDRIE